MRISISELCEKHNLKIDNLLVGLHISRNTAYRKRKDKEDFALQIILNYQDAYIEANGEVCPVKQAIKAVKQKLNN